MNEIAINRGLPSYFGGPDECAEVERLIGATILDFGAPSDFRPEGGGLAIRFRTVDGAEDTYVFAFNECGMWEPETLADLREYSSLK